MSFRGQSASASAVALARTLGRMKPRHQFITLALLLATESLVGLFYLWQVWLVSSWYSADFELMQDSPDALGTYAMLLQGSNFGFWFLCVFIPAGVAITTYSHQRSQQRSTTAVRLLSCMVLAVPACFLAVAWLAFNSPPFPSQCDLWPPLCHSR